MKCFMSDKECDYDIKVDPSKVFVISPFGYPYDDLYDHGIKFILEKISLSEINGDDASKANPTYLKLDRADQTLQLGFVMCQRICKGIQEAGYVFADLTQPNRNVYYELGLSYGMNKKLVIISKKPLSESTHFGLIKDNQEAFIQYRSLDDFSIEKKETFVLAFRKPIICETNLKQIPQSQILNIINSEYSVQGLHERTIKKAITDMDAPPESTLYNSDWEIITKAISKSSLIDEFITDFNKSKVCTIDTTNYDRRITTPYVYFCLGLGHGAEKDVIPLTHTSRSEFLPFDVRGLWHIFFHDLKSLKFQFTGIFQKIDKSWSDEKQNHLYKEIWAPFFKRDNVVNIMTCARSISDDVRGKRTNIDKWDYKSVAEISRFLALKFPKSQTNITAPIKKLSIEEIERMDNRSILSKISENLKDKDCIIVGSPDVSDLAEVVLSRLHNIDPYNIERLKSTGYIIIKDLGHSTKSSFIWQKAKDEKVGIGHLLSKGETGADFANAPKEGIIYGILIIANNPFYSEFNDRKIMILSGFSGVATYSIAKLLTDSNFKNQLQSLYDQIDREPNRNWEILVGARYTEGDIAIEGDNREFDHIIMTQAQKI